MLYKYFFAQLLLLLIILALLMALPIPQNATGIVHPAFSTMMHGGESVVYLPTNKLLAFFLGLCVVSIFGFSILISVQRKDAPSLRHVAFRMILGTLLYIAVLAILFGLHFQTMNDGVLRLFGGFPRDTAWMLFVLSLIPIYFTYYYIKKFHDWILTKEDLHRFNEMVMKRNLE